MAGETVYVTLSSSDFTNPSVGQVGGNAKFLNYFDREIRFDADGVEVALFSISFKTQQQLGDQSIYIYTVISSTLQSSSVPLELTCSDAYCQRLQVNVKSLIHKCCSGSLVLQIASHMLRLNYAMAQVH